MSKFFIKLDRIAAWILMAAIIVYAISGYGMTKGLIDRDLARSLHLSWLGAVGLLAFIIHTFWALHLTFMRWQIWNRYTRLALISFYLLLAWFFLYVHFLYVVPYKNSQPLSNQPLLNQAASTTAISDISTPVASTPTPAVSATSTVVFTAATLAPYNGLNGRPAYAAVSGVVYDVSSAFRNGDHHGYSAGIDLTDLFYEQHQAQLLGRYPIVGTYQK